MRRAGTEASVSISNVRRWPAGVVRVSQVYAKVEFSSRHGGCGIAGRMAYALADPADCPEADSGQ